MVVRCFLCNSIKISFTTESAGVKEGISLEQHNAEWSANAGACWKVSILVVMHSVLDWGWERSVRRLMSSCWHSPSHQNGCQMFVIFSQAEHLKHGDSKGPCAAPKTTSNVQANWHHLMSHTIASKWNYIHLNLSYTSPKEAQKKVSTFNL